MHDLKEKSMEPGSIKKNHNLEATITKRIYTRKQRVNNGAKILAKIRGM